MINPELNDTVAKEKVREVLNDMCLYAIEIPLRYQDFQEIKNPELLEYLQELREKKDGAISSALSAVNADVTKEVLMHCLVRH